MLKTSRTAKSLVIRGKLSLQDSTVRRSTLALSPDNVAALMLRRNLNLESQQFEALKSVSCNSSAYFLACS